MRREPTATPDLARVQRALLAAIRAPTDDGARQDSRAEVAAWIAAPSLDKAGEQIGVYRAMYGLRLRREVAREYPATRALLGADRFDDVARAFAARTGSRSFTLEGYATGLPAFLRRLRIGTLRDERTRAAAVALAAYELERSRVRRRPMATKERRPGRLLPADGARLVPFTHDVEAAYARFAGGEPVAPLRARPLRLAIFRRRDGRVASLRFSAAEAPLLRALRRGQRIESAVAAASDASLRPGAIRAALERWLAAGLLEPAV